MVARPRTERERLSCPSVQQRLEPSRCTFFCTSRCTKELYTSGNWCPHRDTSFHCIWKLVSLCGLLDTTGTTQCTGCGRITTIAIDRPMRPLILWSQIINPGSSQQLPTDLFNFWYTNTFIMCMYHAASSHAKPQTFCENELFCLWFGPIYPSATLWSLLLNISEQNVAEFGFWRD